MKTILWATLTANGNYAQSGPDHPPAAEALADFAAQAMAAGNFVVGRRTFDAFQAGGGPGPLAALDVVVVSRDPEPRPGPTRRHTPQDALAYLRDKGHATALVSGGAELHNAFLGLGLVDELIFNIAPVLEGKGHNLLIDQQRYRSQRIELVESRPLGGGLVQLRYAVAR